MNLNKKYIEDIKKFVEETNLFSLACSRYEVEIKDFFHVSLQVCIDRDAQRENPIGEQVIRNTYNKYKNQILYGKV